MATGNCKSHREKKSDICVHLKKEKKKHTYLRKKNRVCESWQKILKVNWQ